MGNLLDSYGLPAGPVGLPQGAGVQKLGAEARAHGKKTGDAQICLGVQYMFLLCFLNTVFTLSTVHLLLQTT